MKGNKLVLAIAILLFLITITFGTYAIYKSSATGTGTATAAAWVVEVNDTNIVTSSTHTFDLGTITWSSSNHVASGKIAPGSTGTVSLEIDATGTEVSLDYSVEVTEIAVNGTAVDMTNPPFTVTGTSSGSILVSASNKVVTVPLTSAWAGATTDTETKNASDVDKAGKTITLTVEVTATQKLS